MAMPFYYNIDICCAFMTQLYYPIEIINENTRVFAQVTFNVYLFCIRFESKLFYKICGEFVYLLHMPSKNVSTAKPYYVAADFILALNHSLLKQFAKKTAIKI
jgi:hypothetical protein